jgi:hypothetical protein
MALINNVGYLCICSNQSAKDSLGGVSHSNLVELVWIQVRSLVTVEIQEDGYCRIICSSARRKGGEYLTTLINCEIRSLRSTNSEGVRRCFWYSCLLVSLLPCTLMVLRLLLKRLCQRLVYTALNLRKSGLGRVGISPRWYRNLERTSD